MQTMRVALTTHSINPRGGVVHALELARALTDEGHDVTLFAPASKGEKLFRDTACDVVIAPVDGPEHDTVSLVETRIHALKMAIVKHDPTQFDIFHSQDSISGNALAELKHEGKIEGFVRTVHHLDHFSHPRLAAWQTRAWADADCVLCVSELWTHVMRDVHGIGAMTVSNGIDLNRYTTTPTHDDAALKVRLGLDGWPIILAVGGVEERKNTHVLLDAFIELRSAFPDAKLVIAGGASLLDHNAYTRAFASKLAEANLFESVIITGPLDDADMPALFRLADVLAMVSLREGFGLVVLEALASGTPVVASNIAPFTEYLTDTTCCWATPTNSSSIASALMQAVTGQHKTDFNGSVADLLARMSWHASARKHADIYRELLASRTLQPH